MISMEVNFSKIAKTDDKLSDIKTFIEDIRDGKIFAIKDKKIAISAVFLKKVVIGENVYFVTEGFTVGANVCEALDVIKDMRRKKLTVVDSSSSSHPKTIGIAITSSLIDIQFGEIEVNNTCKDCLEEFVCKMKEINEGFKTVVTYTGNGKDFNLPATIEYVVTYYDGNRKMIAKRGEELATCHDVKSLIGQVAALMKMGYKPELCSIPDYFVDNKNFTVIFDKRIIIGNDETFVFI